MGWAERFNLLIGNVTSGENTDSFTEAQLSQIATYRSVEDPNKRGRIALGRVIVPTDGASAERRARYAAYAEVRQARMLQPNGEKRTLFAPDLVGPLEAIAARLRADRTSSLRTNYGWNCPTSSTGASMSRSCAMRQGCSTISAAARWPDSFDSLMTGFRT